MKKSRILIRTLCLVFVLSFFTFSLYALEEAKFKEKGVKDAGDITVYVNGEKLDFDAPPKLSGGRTLVPLRKITESLGYEVTYNAERRKVSLSDGKMEYVFYIDNNYVYVKDKETFPNLEIPYALEVVPSVCESRTYVPLRTIAELCSAKVTWDEKTRTINIDAPTIPDSEIVELNSAKDSYDFYHYQGQIKNGKPDGVGFIRYGFESSSYYKGRWANGLPEGPGFMEILTGLEHWTILGEFSEGRLVNGTVTSSNGISFIRKGLVHSSYAQAGASYWVVPNDKSLNEEWQNHLIRQIPKIK